MGSPSFYVATFRCGTMLIDFNGIPSFSLGIFFLILTFMIIYSGALFE